MGFLTGKTAIITGVESLKGAPVEADDLRAGAAMVIAGIIAFAVVCLIVIVRYRVVGAVAAIALLGQLAGTIACISGYFDGSDSFTLTIPGIAGIILSIGMAVDANVLPFQSVWVLTVTLLRLNVFATSLEKASHLTLLLTRALRTAFLLLSTVTLQSLSYLSCLWARLVHRIASWAPSSHRLCQSLAHQ